ncbi:MAG: hypothetical protein QXU18_07775 [Thermoplasmatales archaeon]
MKKINESLFGRVLVYIKVSYRNREFKYVVGEAFFVCNKKDSEEISPTFSF